MLCHANGEKCGGTELYACKQMKTNMTVAYTKMVEVGDHYDMMVWDMRNITINIGCSCVNMEHHLDLAI